MVTASFVLGLVGIIAWLIPLIGFPVTIVGLVLSIKGRSKSPEKKSLATAAMVLNIIFLSLTLINSAIGAYRGATGN